MERRKIKELGAIVFLASFAYFLLTIYTNLGLALVFLFLYFGLTGRWYRDYLISIFRLGRLGTTWVVGVFLSLFVFVSLSSPWVLFFRYTAPEISVVFLLSGLLAWYLRTYIVKKGISLENNISTESNSWQFMPGKVISFWVYIVVFAVATYILQNRLGDGVVNSPWQIIQEEYIYVYALATFVLCLNILSKLPSRQVLFLLILHTFLTVSYLPLTHVLIYGADSWRHMATEAQILESGRIALKDFGSGFNAIVNALNPGRFSYAWFWGLGVVVAKLTGGTLIEVNKWLGPLLFTIGFPVLLFAFLKSWFKEERLPLLLVWLSLIFFAFQVGGAFTLPVNTGFLFFLVLLILLTKHLDNPQPGRKWFLGLLGFFSLFGYLVYFILFFLAWGIMVLTKKSWNAGKKNVLIIVGAGILIPFFELVFNYSDVSKINLLGQIKQLVGNFTAYYLATGPRQHDILTGNILFNQTPSYAYVGNFLLEHKPWLVAVAILVWAGVAWGVREYFRKKESRGIGILFLGVFVSLLIGRYFLVGEQILSRRLDLVFALGAVFFIGFTVKRIFSRYQIAEKATSRLLAILVVFIFSLAITASYTLGPDTNTVSLTGYRNMEVVWDQEKENEKHCVIADTYPLLALEFISKKEIVGGGFPMNAYFAQLERVALWQEIKNKGYLTKEELEKAKELTGAGECHIVGGSLDPWFGK